MAWETRRGRRYYYRKERGSDGRTRSIYCGGGARGEAAEREDLERRSAPRAVAAPHGGGDVEEIVSPATADSAPCADARACCAAPLRAAPAAEPVAAARVATASVRYSKPSLMTLRDARAHVWQAVESGANAYLVVSLLFTERKIDRYTCRQLFADCASTTRKGL